MSLVSRFQSDACVLRSVSPLVDDQIRRVAPSIFAGEKHESRSARYTYIPTIDILTALRRDGFEPFMVCQTRVRTDGKRDFTKHMIRMRHPDTITDAEAPEVILLNSHDGSSSYQMIAGLFRFACHNGLVFGDTLHDVRVPHKGNIVENVVEGAHNVLDGFNLIREHKEGMKAITLDSDEQRVFARAALALRYDVTEASAPITEDQLLRARRVEDRKDDLWSTFNRVQENVIQGGLHGKTKTGKKMSTRGVRGIDQDIRLNRGLWVLAEEMKKLKA